jgi:prepilin-type N-terminal cleavage/methylation domain-containing protein
VKNKKGFTLVELLAVIVILGIVAVITVPIISRVIKKAGTDVFSINEELMSKGAESYFSINDDLLPTYIGGKSTVTLTNLVADGYMKDIKNPKDESTLCEGYVVAIKDAIEGYEYNAYLKCGTNYITDNYDADNPVNDPDAPTISLSADAKGGIADIVWFQNSTYVDPGYTATDIQDGDITGSVVVTGSVNVATLGEYTLTYNVHDLNNNVAPTLTRKVTVIKSEYVFDYIGANAQTFTVPYAGTYKLEAWGAEGGSSTWGASSVGGKGGYTVGNIALTKDTNLYFYIGGKGTFTSIANTASLGGYNGGGNGRGDISESGAGGGGASDIRKTGQTLNDRIMVAGGGGGGGEDTETGGAGGGLTGSNASPGAFGGTQVAGGAFNGSPGAYAGALGLGGYYIGADSGSGGGGGYYGGGGSYESGSGGGSSFISGHAGCSTITGYTFTTTTTTAGLRSGNGYAKATWIGY